MKRFSHFAVIIAMLLVLTAGCRKEGKSDSRPAISCGLPPVAYLAARICGDRYQVYSLLPDGRSPHDYSPSPRDIRRAAGSKIFFSTGMTFERSAAAALQKSTTILDVTSGIRRRHLEGGHQCSGNHSHDHHHDELDPHVWLSTYNAEAIARNILDAMIKLDPAGEKFYRENFAALEKDLLRHRNRIGTILKPFAGRDFFVYHPAFGYFADEAGMKQHPLEINGRELKSQQLAAVITQARRENIRVIFVQPQFNPGQSKMLAKEINGRVQELDPLAYDLMHTFTILPETIRDGFTGENGK